MYLQNLRVPIPEECRITKTGLVQHLLHSLTNPKAGRHWTTIGKLPPEGAMYDEEGNQLMVPNSLYRLWFSAFYHEVSRKDPDNIPPFFSHGANIGSFALFLGAVTKSGLYDILIDVFGVVTANALLDIAMYYNMSERLDLKWVTSHLEDQIVFSVRPHTQQWYQNRVGSITEEEIEAFMRQWTRHRQRAARRDTVIHLDATDETVSRGMYSEEWGALTVCETGGEYPGLPLAYYLCRDGASDVADARKAMALFRDLGLGPKRVVGGLSPLKPEFFAICDALQMPWILDMRPNFLGFADMLKRHEEELFQGQGTPITARDPLVATSEDNVLLFGPDTLDPDRRSFVALYCNPKTAEKGRKYMQEHLDKAYPEACAVLDKLQQSKGKKKLQIPDPARDAKKTAEDGEEEPTAEQQALNKLYQAVCQEGGFLYTPDAHAWTCLKMEYHPEERRYHLVIDEDEVQYHRCMGNYFALAASEPMDLQTMSDDFPLSLYLGDSLFATTFSAMHAQLSSLPPDYADISSWFFVAYLSDIVRALLMPSFCEFVAERDGEVFAEQFKSYSEEELLETDTDVFLSYREMFHWLYELRFVRHYVDGNLEYEGDTRGLRGALLRAAGIKPSSLPLFSNLVNTAEDPHGVRVQRQTQRTIPALPKKRGRPAGSKNKPKQDTDKD